MKEIAREIRIAVEEAFPRLSNLQPEEVSAKPNQEKWSKKEMLGHLIDSATNNHQRFVRAAYAAADRFPGYDQNRWVIVQHYQDMEWAELVQFWAIYNRHLCRVIECLPAAILSTPCNLGGDRMATLEFVIRDYLRHLRHHLDKL
jgi:hypothetical protein